MNISGGIIAFFFPLSLLLGGIGTGYLLYPYSLYFNINSCFDQGCVIFTNMMWSFMYGFLIASYSIIGILHLVGKVRTRICGSNECREVD